MKDRSKPGNASNSPSRLTTDRREAYRKQLLDSIGGWTGTVIAALPTVVFVIVNSTTSLRPAIIAAVGAALGLAGVRLALKQSPQQALSGLVGVLVAAIIASRTGQARGYFLLGIWTSFLYAVPFLVSVLVRRPLVGFLWEFLDPAPPDPDEPGRAWYRRRALLKAYSIATIFGTVLFLARGVVQATLYHVNATGWLAFARVAMGYPLYIAAVGAGYWVVRHARKDMKAHLTDELAEPGHEQPPGAPGVTADATDATDTAGTSSEPTGTASGSADERRADRGLGLG